MATDVPYEQLRVPQAQEKFVDSSKQALTAELEFLAKRAPQALPIATALLEFVQGGQNVPAFSRDSNLKDSLGGAPIVGEMLPKHSGDYGTLNQPTQVKINPQFEERDVLIHELVHAVEQELQDLGVANPLTYGSFASKPKVVSILDKEAPRYLPSVQQQMPARDLKHERTAYAVGEAAIGRRPFNMTPAAQEQIMAEFFKLLAAGREAQQADQTKRETQKLRKLHPPK